eukprot:2481647-Rhodomonas_salina.1
MSMGGIRFKQNPTRSASDLVSFLGKRSTLAGKVEYLASVPQQPHLSPEEQERRKEHDAHLARGH